MFLQIEMIPNLVLNEADKSFESDVCAHGCGFFAIDKSSVQCALVQSKHLDDSLSE